MSINFYGKAKPLTNAGIWRATELLGFESTAKVRAVMKVEALNVMFRKDGRPPILCEGHIFYRNLRGNKRDRAIRQGLAARRWGIIKYMRSHAGRYRKLERMMAISESAALKSASWGGPQILGLNYKQCGYKTVKAFVAAMCESGDLQIMAMAEFIKNDKRKIHSKVAYSRITMHQALMMGDYHVFAELYNGPAQEKHNYEGRIAKAVRHFAKRPLAKKMAKIVREERIKEAAPPTKVQKVTKQGAKDLVEKVAPPFTIMVLIQQFMDSATELKGVAVYLPILGQAAAVFVGLAICLAMLNMYQKWRAA